MIQVQPDLLRDTSVSWGFTHSFNKYSSRCWGISRKPNKIPCPHGANEKIINEIVGMGMGGMQY